MVDVVHIVSFTVTTSRVGEVVEGTTDQIFNQTTLKF